MNTKPVTDNPKTYGVKHWFYQVMPPVLTVSILFTIERGGALLYLVGIFALPALISVISVIVKLFSFTRKKFYLVRPLLTIILFILVVGVSKWAYSVALEQTVNAAKIIHDACNLNSLCPKAPAGWEVSSTRIIKTELGSSFKYSATYHPNKATFQILLHQGRDLGETITGGKHVPLKVERYREDHNDS